jgi:hypothetical protein
MKTAVRSFVRGLVLVLGCSAALADPSTFWYAGTVDYAQFNPTYGGTPPAQIGDRLVLTYTFQSDATPEPIFPWRTRYPGQGPLLAEIHRGGTLIGAWTVPVVEIMLVDDLNTAFAGYVGWDDRYDVSGRRPDAAGGALPFDVAAGVALLEHEVLAVPTALQGLALPLVPLDPSLFDSAKLNLSRIAEVPLGGGVFQHHQHWFFQATIDSFGTAPAIPEPASFLLLGAGLVTLAAWRRLRGVRAGDRDCHRGWRLDDVLRAHDRHSAAVQPYSHSTAS